MDKLTKKHNYKNQELNWNKWPNSRVNLIYFRMKLKIRSKIKPLIKIKNSKSHGL